MKIVLCILPITCFIMFKFKFKTWNNPYVIFNLLWSIVGILILYGNRSVYTPSKIAMLCVIIGILGFNLSAVSIRFILGKQNSLNKNYIFNKRIAIIFSIIVLIASLFLSIDTIQSFLSGASYADIRNDYYTYSNSVSVLLYYLREYVIDPLRYVVIVSAIFSLFKKEYRSKLLIANAAFCVLLQAITSGGRYILMNTFFMLICGAFMLISNVELSLKQKVQLFILGGLIAYGIIFLTDSRLKW